MLNVIAGASPAPDFVEDVITHMLTWRRARQACALVTLVNVEGSSPCPLGSQMAVREDGLVVGQITAGCAQAAIVTQAVAHIAHKSNACIRYGKGSDYLDVALPCGSGIDIHFDTWISTDVLEQLQAIKALRRKVTLAIDTASTNSSATVVVGGEAGTAMTQRDGHKVFKRTYTPVVRMVIAGTGPMVTSLARLAAPLNWELAIASPQLETLQALREPAITCQHLRTTADFDPALIDPWTASVVLFHDHQWEPEILRQMLSADGFYIGALGSRQTHAQRRAALSDLGCDDTMTARIHGPVGLDLGARTPPEIALSIVAQILSLSRSASCQTTG